MTHDELVQKRDQLKKDLQEKKEKLMRVVQLLEDMDIDVAAINANDYVKN